MDAFSLFGIGNEIISLSEKAEAAITKSFDKIEKTALEGQMRVLSAFKNNRVSDANFTPCYGYGYDDVGRDTLDRIYAEVFGSEAAIVRSNFISGTHTLAVMLFSVLRPGDVLFSAVGRPYDTLEGVIGIAEKKSGSLADFGIGYTEAEMKDDKPDYDKIKEILTQNSKIKAVLIQRSKGYAWRDSLTISDIKRLIDFIKGIKNDVIVMVDNCYGEFVVECEPTAVGADLMAGSLIKNPGGGLAGGGGYIAGKREYVELAADRLTAPGLGIECGANMGHIKSLYQGFFMAPHTVAQSLKTAVFAAEMFSLLGFEVAPTSFENRGDIIQAVKLNSAENLCAFCRGIQRGAPIDSFVVPEPWDMPGYSDQVIMAAGAFVSGASIEISADGPLREPFAAYMQGGLTYESGKIAVLCAADNIIKLRK